MHATINRPGLSENPISLTDIYCSLEEMFNSKVNDK